MKVNKIVRISLSGGLIGLLTTNPKRALGNVIDKYNQEGWNAVHFTEHKQTNFLVFMFQILVLLATLGLWTFGAGYLVLFEKAKG